MACGHSYLRCVLPELLWSVIELEIITVLLGICQLFPLVDRVLNSIFKLKHRKVICRDVVELCQYFHVVICSNSFWQNFLLSEPEFVCCCRRSIQVMQSRSSCLALSSFNPVRHSNLSYKLSRVTDGPGTIKTGNFHLLSLSDPVMFDRTLLVFLFYDTPVLYQYKIFSEPTLDQPSQSRKR